MIFERLKKLWDHVTGNDILEDGLRKLDQRKEMDKEFVFE